MAKSPKASQRSVFAAHVWYGPFFLFPRRNGFQGHFRAKERALRRESPCRNFADSRKSCVRKGFRPSFGRGRASDCEISDGFSHDQPSDAIARFSCLDLTEEGKRSWFELEFLFKGALQDLTRVKARVSATRKRLNVQRHYRLLHGCRIAWRRGVGRKCVGGVCAVRLAYTFRPTG